MALGLPAFGAVVFGLSVYYAAIVSKILQAGLAALPGGQMEAGTAIGLTRWQTLRLIPFPQVVRLMLLNYSCFGDRSRFPLFVVVMANYLTVNPSLSRIAVAVGRRTSQGR